MKINNALNHGEKILHSRLIPNSYLDSEILMAKTINKGAKILRSKFIPNSYLDSEILMIKTINKDKKYILLNSNKNLNKNDLTNFYNLINKRSTGKPIAYLTNKKFFWNSEFFVTGDTLIPRPDTELIVENVLNLTKVKIK